MSLVEYKEMCTIVSGTEKRVKSGNELIDECLKNCNELIKSIEEFKAYLELQRE